MFFELEDIKRRHSLYYDIYNVGVWVPTPDNSLRWNATRGVMAGVAANMIGEAWHNFYINWRLLLKEYQQPQSVKQFYSFARATVDLPNFKKSMSTRAQYALTAGAIDWGTRIAMFRWINNGWQRLWGSFEVGFLRKVPGTIVVSLLTAPVGIPFEMARLAYYADKTFPKELQRGYSSYFNALARIPFEEGPYFLFKNSSPIFIRNFIQTLTLFYTFDWLKDKLSLFHRLGEVPYFPLKVVNAAISTYLACIFSYPFSYAAREMVDLWPREKGTPCPWDGNYRKAAVSNWYSEFHNNSFPGMFKNYVSRQGPSMFLALWFADTLGIFSYWKVDMFSGQGTNSWEDSYA